MRVERLGVTVLSAPLGATDTVAMSFGKLTDRRMCVVEVEADGAVGIGESWINYPAWAPRERLGTLCDGVASLLVGMEVSDPREIHGELTRQLLPLGRQWGALGPIWQSLSGVDMALWDLHGKLHGQSVAALLGGDGGRGHVPAYGSGVGPTRVAELCERAMQAGLPAVKTKVGFGAERDAAILGEARSTLGEKRRLFADANQAWNLAEAKAMCELLERHDVEWLEEPLTHDDLDELEELGADTTIPLATGENVYGITEFERYVESPAIHLIQPDLAKCGGITMGAAVAEHAGRCGTGVAPHCYGGAIGIVASLHVGAAFPSVRWIELDVRDNPLRTDVLTTPLRLDDGELAVPNGPGLGIELADTVIQHYEQYVEERTRRDL
ncbi:mandelate racemase/muconate lactonizing enzyme family protein [Actinobacteria bacterium YIM 96077]|uniref:Mandelate racemase/muconate lactonizing enzyme family protein n=1 Tax=Phytoactinopolyspora halophila TaxID=1981511 RepID=A0A329QCY7_9ACTN|nr:mandelate racemase/muconate lactonizing enzyme family protein [Phytoactinopolyspora halophila]AYY14182.1 mandelate racemase/muconate lactonizing enzyme family protein [Actinobacteria bacterium YIM 96077]RAW10226.1 mandelate racemase/muconate lactonizing enzyme family protein [Phytoactinopolyspora halophila]